jgi:hypothetical protein
MEQSDITEAEAIWNQSILVLISLRLLCRFAPRNDGLVCLCERKRSNLGLFKNDFLSIILFKCLSSIMYI